MRLLVQQSAGFAWSAILLAVTSGGNALSAITAAGWPAIASAIVAGLMYYAAAYWLYLSALNRVSAALAGGSFNIIPIVTVAVAYVALGERLNGPQLLGAVCIILSASALFWLLREQPK